jgi:hypothetical protein
MQTQPLPSATLSDQAKATFVKFVVAQKSEGLREALAMLLKQTEFRFAGIWLFKNDVARAVVHVDRDRPQHTAL